MPGGKAVYIVVLFDNRYSPGQVLQQTQGARFINKNYPFKNMCDDRTNDQSSKNCDKKITFVDQHI